MGFAKEYNIPVNISVRVTDLLYELIQQRCAKRLNFLQMMFRSVLRRGSTIPMIVKRLSALKHSRTDVSISGEKPGRYG